MNRYISLAASVLVAVGVFIWLAGPLLETQFGTEALITAYAGFACATGILTYVVGRRLKHPTGRPTDGTESTNETADLDQTTLDETLVDDELEQLRDNS